MQTFFDVTEVQDAFNHALASQQSDALAAAHEEQSETLLIQLWAVIGSEGEHSNLIACAGGLDFTESEIAEMDENGVLYETVEKCLEEVCDDLNKQLPLPGVQFGCSWNEHWGGLYLCAYLNLPVAYVSDTEDGLTFCAEHMEGQDTRGYTPLFQFQMAAEKARDPDITYICANGHVISQEITEDETHGS